MPSSYPWSDWSASWASLCNCAPSSWFYMDDKESGDLTFVYLGQLFWMPCVDLCPWMDRSNSLWIWYWAYSWCLYHTFQPLPSHSSQLFSALACWRSNHVVSHSCRSRHTTEVSWWVANLIPQMWIFQRSFCCFVFCSFKLLGGACPLICQLERSIWTYWARIFAKTPWLIEAQGCKFP